MTRSRVIRPLAAAMLLAGLTLTGCTAQSTVRDAGAPAEGGTLTIALDRELPTLDVTNGLIGQQPILVLSNALYAPLMRPTVGGAVEPGLAESLTSDETGTDWTLTLPAGVTFSDGSPLDAAAVEAHIRRLADPATGSSTAAQASQIIEMNVVDEVTLTFQLTVPNVDFGGAFARGLGMVTSSTAVDEFGFPLGAGPYVVEDFVAGSSVTVVRNENFTGPRGNLDEVTFLMMPDADSRFQSLQSGDVDLIWTEAASQFQQAREDSDLEVWNTPAAVSSMLLNLSEAEFADPEVRRALAQAIDRDAVNAVVNLGEGVTVDSPYALLDDLAPEVDYPEYDLEAAQDVLEGAGLSFDLTVENRPDAMQRATAIQDMLGNAGVAVTLVPIESAAFGTALFARDFEALDFITSTFADPAGATNMASTDGSFNFTGYSNATVDAALRAGASTTDRVARATEFTTVGEQLAADLPMLFLTASNAGFIRSADLRGMPDLEGITLVSVDVAGMGWAE